MFEGRGGEDIGIELSQLLELGLNGAADAIDLTQLCIIPGLHVWHLYVDAVVSRFEL